MTKDKGKVIASEVRVKQSYCWMCYLFMGLFLLTLSGLHCSDGLGCVFLNNSCGILLELMACVFCFLRSFLKDQKRTKKSFAVKGIFKSTKSALKTINKILNGFQGFSHS